MRGEAEDTIPCKTYALNIGAIKLVKLKAILENRKRNIYASVSGEKSFYLRAARAHWGTGNDCQQTGVVGVKCCGAACSPWPTRCPHVWLGFPFSVGHSGRCQASKDREKSSERKKHCLLLITRSEGGKKKESWSFRPLLTFRFETRLRKGCYRHTAQPPWWQVGKNERRKKYKNIIHQVRLIEKLQKAIMILRMCRPLLLAASKHRKSCSGLCLHCVDLSMPSGPGWALHALSTVDIHTHGVVHMHCTSFF